MKVDLPGRLRRSRRIMVIKQRYVGDSVWTLLFLENLKSNLPDASIAIIANKGTDAFFHHNDYVERVFPYPNREIKKGGMAGVLAFLRFMREVRRFRADTVIELTDSDKSAAIAFLSGAPLRIGFKLEPALRNRLLNHLIEPPGPQEHWCRINLDLVEKLGLKVLHREIHNRVPEWALSSLRVKCPAVFDDDGRSKVLVHPGARVALRQWGAERFAELCDLLAPTCRVILAAGPDEGALLGEVLAGMKTVPEVASSELGLEEFAALASRCDLFVGNDSGPIHIAATQTFTVGIYGPNSDYLAGPWTPHKYVFEDDSLSCRKSCSHLACSNESYHACMKRLTPETVFRKVTEILGAIPKQPEEHSAEAP